MSGPNCNGVQSVTLLKAAGATTKTAAADLDAFAAAAVRYSTATPANTSALLTAYTNAANKLIADIQANACQALGQGCFAAGTKLWTPQGYRNVEDIQPGDLVYARDENDPAAPVVVRVVEERFERTGNVLHLHVAGELIRTTPEHPFYVFRKGWTQAGSLVEGDWISTLAGGWVVVEELYDTGMFEAVYNLRVAEDHTYFVGDENWAFGVWAHNAYLGLSNPSVRVQGDGYATLASGWWETLPDGNRNGATVAVTMVGNTQYVALYANIGNGPQQFTQAQVNNFMADATAAGWVPIHTSGNIHAEMALYMQQPTAAVIGISNPSGPCNNQCRSYFTQQHYYNIVWPGSMRASWGNA